MQSSTEPLKTVFSQHAPDIAEFYFSEHKRYSLYLWMIFFTFFPWTYINNGNDFKRSQSKPENIFEWITDTEAISSYNLPSDKNYV